MSSIVIGTASCNTFRIWEQDSIALAFVDQGAAAYAGFAYSSNEGYLIGEFEGVPFRYTWPDFPIFVKVPGLTAAWERDPFYNSRLQMADLGNDKYVLFVHRGGDFSILLRPNPPWYWRVTDPLTDALDHTLLYASQTSGDVLALFAAGPALLGTVWFARRRTSPVWAMPTSVLLGIASAALHGLYALVRLGHVTVTSKPVEFSCLALIGTGLLTGCGAFPHEALTSVQSCL